MDRSLREALSASEAGRAYLDKKAKAKRDRASRVKAKPRAAWKTKAERTVEDMPRKRAVYAAVREREDGLCSVQLAASVLGTCEGALQIDHQWGRGKAPTMVENCRMLCAKHHHRKTDSETEDGPSRLMWLCDFREHALSHRYYAEVAKADARIALERAKHPDRKQRPSVAIELVREENND